MTQLDEAIRSELREPFGAQPAPDHVWGEVSQRVDRRRRRRSLRRRTLIGLGLVVVAAAALVTSLPTNSGVPNKAHTSQVIDPAAGRGGFSVAPSTGLVNDQPVTVSIHGLHPNAAVWLTMCVGRPQNFQAGVNQCNAPAKMVTLGPHGTASVTFTVSRYLSPGGFQVDCATYGPGCSVALVEPDSVATGEIVANTEAVTFERTAPVPPNPLQISAAPSGPYADGQTVTVSGAGFPSSTTVRVGECPTDTDCGGYFQTVESTPQGTFTAVVTLHRTYSVEQGDAGGGESPVQIDCSQTLRCFVMAEEAAAPYSAASSIPLSFASTAPAGIAPSSYQAGRTRSTAEAPAHVTTGGHCQQRCDHLAGDNAHTVAQWPSAS